ncbi:hypothetical protein HY468_00830 [Candidatus Roizmanbacteria bacterium]|nr:hypothetical protein [Candidatus Roizmanbacteria bacterium]
MNLKQLVRTYYQYIVKDVLLLYALLVSVISIVVSGVIFFLFSRQLPSLVPLYYSLPWSEGRLAGAQWLLLLPISAVGIVIVNLIIALIFYRSEAMLSRIVGLAAACFALMQLYAMIRIIFLIG